MQPTSNSFYVCLNGKNLCHGYGYRKREYNRFHSENYGIILLVQKNVKSTSNQVARKFSTVPLKMRRYVSPRYYQPNCNRSCLEAIVETHVINLGYWDRKNCYCFPNGNYLIALNLRRWKALAYLFLADRNLLADQAIYV